MTKFEKLQSKNEKEFRRMTGVSKSVFEIMLKTLKEGLVKRKKEQKGAGGRPLKLSAEDLLLMTLEYLREYRTYAQIGLSYGLSESKAYRNVCIVEDILIQAKEFTLPGKKALLDPENKVEAVIVDVTECSIQRPKKTKKLLFGKKETTYS